MTRPEPTLPKRIDLIAASPCGRFAFACFYPQNTYFAGTTESFTASDLARNAGSLLEAAQRGPVEITKHGEPKYVVLAKDDHDRLRGAADSRIHGRVADMPTEEADAIL